MGFIHEFREIVRVARSPLSKRFENDAEHSYQLAMMAWFLIDQDKLKLNKSLCFMYALAHDLVEVYAGDTYIFDEDKVTDKHKRERRALSKIRRKYKNFSSLITTLENYEKKNDKESKFIYALDKIIDPLQIYMEKGELWKEKNVELEKLIKYKNSKIAISKSIDKYWQELLLELNKSQKDLFN